MMNPYELRLGNIVLDGNREGFVESIGRSRIKLRLSHSVVTIDTELNGLGVDVSPSPLSREYLLSICVANHVHQGVFEYTLKESTRGDEFFIHESGGDYHVSLNDIDWIKTVENKHELQNAYFTLLNEELI